MRGTRKRIDRALLLLGLTEDPAEPEGSTAERNLRAVGGFGMAVFFVTLLVNGEVESSPAWLIWPAFAVMTASVVGILLIRLRRDRT